MRSKIFSSRIEKLTESKSVEIADKIRKMKREGIDIIELQTGEPDFGTPQYIINAAYSAMKEGYTHYTSSRGVPELRDAISEKLQNENKIDADPEKEIIVTPGAVHAVFSAILATINSGDEVIIPDPCWVVYPACVEIAGGKLIRIPLNSEDNFELNRESIEKAITPRTKMLIINYPCNPTGTTLTRDKLKYIADIAKEHDLLVLSDEVYEKILYDGLKHTSIGSLADMEERTITVNGFSKTYAMTGWRIGYASASSAIIDQMLKIQQYSVTCASAFAQKAAIAALNGLQEPVHDMIKEYDQRRQLIVKKLNNIDGIYCRKPMGTFYAFTNISKLGTSSMEFANFLLDKARVGVVPGSAYGQSGDGYVRLSFANSKKNIEKAMERIEKFLGTKGA